MKAPSVEGMPGIDVTFEPHALARLGARSADLHGLVAGVRRGVPVGSVQRGAFRDPVVLEVDLQVMVV